MNENSYAELMKWLDELETDDNVTIDKSFEELMEVI